MTQLGAPGASHRGRSPVGLAPTPTQPRGPPRFSSGISCKPFSAACREGLGLLSAVTFASASKFHPGPLPSALASWQEAGYGFVMFPLQTRPGRARVWARVRTGAGSILPPAPLSEPPRGDKAGSTLLQASRFRGQRRRGL